MKAKKPINIPPYTEHIQKLTEYLQKKGDRAYRNTRFENTDINLMFRGNINQLFDIEIDDSKIQIDLKINLANNKVKYLRFTDYAKFLLWIYRRIETTTIHMNKSSDDDKSYYQTIINQLVQLNHLMMINHIIKQSSNHQSISSIKSSYQTMMINHIIKQSSIN